tara:strand:+ start:1441 stop:2154 length:714 start_codon:yes stop_codon:yes gene_type:complete
MANIDKKIREELRRFNTIGKYIDETLNETFVGIGGGSGFVKPQGGSDRLKRFKREFEEQDDEVVLDPDAETEELEDEIPVEGGDEELEMDMEDDMEIEEPESDSTELDITDLVKKEDEISNELEGQSDILSKNTDSLGDLMTKLDDLETHLSSMDDMVGKISDLEDKIEKYRPRTPEENMELRKHDSGPFANTLTDFFTDKEEIFDKTGKKQYILKQEDIENYNEVDIKNSFNSPEE